MRASECVLLDSRAAKRASRCCWTSTGTSSPTRRRWACSSTAWSAMHGRERVGEWKALAAAGAWAGAGRAPARRTLRPGLPALGRAQFPAPRRGAQPAHRFARARRVRCRRARASRARSCGSRKRRRRGGPGKSCGTWGAVAARARRSCRRAAPGACRTRVPNIPCRDRARSPGTGTKALAVHSHTPPGPILPAAAAHSHSASVGSRRFAQRHQPCASSQSTWITGSCGYQGPPAVESPLQPRAAFLLPVARRACRRLRHSRGIGRWSRERSRCGTARASTSCAHFSLSKTNDCPGTCT